jgi:hypothetical protein
MAADDVFTCEVTQIDSGTAGADLSAQAIAVSAVTAS